MVRKVLHINFPRYIFFFVFYVNSITFAFGQHTTQNVTGDWEVIQTDPTTVWVYDQWNPPNYDGNLTGAAYNIYGNITRNGNIVMSTDMTIQSGSTLTVTGDLTASGGTLTIVSGGTLIVGGSLSTTTGIVVESGARLIVYNNFNVSNGSLNTSGDVIVLGNYFTQSNSVINVSGNLVVQGDFNYAAGGFTTTATPVSSQLYLLGSNNTSPATNPVSNNAGNLTDLQTNDPALYALYSTLVSPECPNSTVTYSVTADATYNGGSSDQVGDTFNWTVNGGTITAISPSGGTIDNSGSPSTASVTISSASTTTVSITVQWNTTGLNTITVQQVSDAGCDGTTSTMNVSVGDYEKPVFNPSFSYGDLSECPDNVSLDNVQQGTLILDLPVNNTDNCSSTTSLYFSVSGATTVARTDVTGKSVTDPVVFNQGTSLVTYYLDDGSGNESTITYNVTILHKPELGDIQ